MRPWLEPGLSRAGRAELLDQQFALLGWRVRRWPRWAPSALRKRSQAWAVARTVYLRDEIEPGSAAELVSLAHEYDHAARAEANGRWRHVPIYAGGPVLVVVALAALVVAAALSAAGMDLARLASCAALGLVGCAVAAWGPSERFRREDELRATAAGLAARTADAGSSPTSGATRHHVGHHLLHSWCWPYLVGGDPVEVEGDLARRAADLRS